MSNPNSNATAWSDQGHAEFFDYLACQPPFLVKKFYEGFNEGRLLKHFYDDIRGSRFFEIGCATGELYRYISNFVSRFEYHGFDISAPAIDRASKKYPNAQFTLLPRQPEGDRLELRSGIVAEFGQPDVVWSRDVVLHQARPYDFMSELIDLAGEAIVLRLRNRDVRETVTDPQISCQYHRDGVWIPYMIQNTDELIDKIAAHTDVNNIVISRSYEVLGGHNGRYLPKDLYLTTARTAETAVFIQKGPRVNGSVDVTFRDQPDRPRHGIVSRVVRKMFTERGKRRARRDADQS